MTKYSMSAPDGNTYQIDGPVGASDDQVRAQILQQHPDAEKPTLRNAMRQERDWHLPGTEFLRQTVVEPAAQALTGTAASVAGAAAGLYAGTAAETEAQDKYHMTAGPAFDVGWEKMKEVFHAIQQKYTYGARSGTGTETDPKNFWQQQGVAPMSERGQAVTGAIGRGISALTDPIASTLRGTAVEWAAQQAGALPPEVAQRIRRVGSDISDIAAPFALGELGGLAGRGLRAGVGPRAAIPPNILQSARNAGYLVPEGALPAIAGRSRVSEALSRYHEGTNNELARRNLAITGEHLDAPVEPVELEQVREQAHASYQQLRGTVDLGSAVGPQYRAFQQLLQDTARNIPDIDTLVAGLAPGERGFLINDVNKLLAEFSGKRTFEARALATRMETLRTQWDTVKHIDADTATGLQVRKYVLGMTRRNVADTLQQVLNWHGERTAPQLSGALQQSTRLINDSYIVEDARNPTTGNISAHEVMQLQASRSVTGGLRTMAETARHMPNIVQDLNPVQAGLLSPQSLSGRWAQASWPERFQMARKVLAWAGVPATYEALAHKAIGATLGGGAAGVAAYGGYMAARWARPALRRMLLGHRYHQRFYPPSWRRPTAVPPRQPMGAAGAAAAGTVLSGMDQGDQQ